MCRLSRARLSRGTRCCSPVSASNLTCLNRLPCGMHFYLLDTTSALYSNAITHISITLPKCHSATYSLNAWILFIAIIKSPMLRARSRTCEKSASEAGNCSVIIHHAAHSMKYWQYPTLARCCSISTGTSSVLLERERVQIGINLNEPCSTRQI